MKRIIALFFTALLLNNVNYAQDKNWCTTDEHAKELEKEFEWLKDKNELYNAVYRAGLYTLENNGLNKTEGDYIDSTTQYKIALVFHIVHTYNDEGQDWISDADVLNCMESINMHWNGSYIDTADVAPYYKDKIGDGKITFVLANKDPYGNCTNGIDRIHSYTTLTGGTRAKMNQWPPERYINIWAAHDAGSPNALAYAVRVSDASALPYLDGVMSANNGIEGYPSSRRYTIAHELAHVLNIQHVWGATNSPEVACGDDDVLDTAPTRGNEPVVNSAKCLDSNFINKREEDCWDTSLNLSYARYLLDPTCTSPVQNIMNYAYCYKNFTHGQMMRARACLQNFYGLSDNANRENLIKQSTHVSTGIDGPAQDCVPIADFHSQNRFGVEGAGNTFVLKNFTYNTPLNGISYKWTSPNSSPSTSTSPLSFLAKYPSSTGWQSVTLEATRSGKVGTTTKDNYIFIQRAAVNNDKQTFEDDARNEYWPIFNYYDNQFKWEVTDQGAYWGNKCIRYRGYDNRSFPASSIADAQGDFDDFFTEKIQIGASNQKLNFWLAGAAKGSDAGRIKDDELEISFSTNNGLLWVPFERIKGGNLYPNGSMSTGEFVPGGFWDYTPMTVDIPSSINNKEVLFRFRMKPGKYANNVYIDDIEVSSLPTGLSKADKTGFIVSPNPLFEHNDLQINSETSLKGAQVKITDLTGRIIYSGVISENSNQASIEREIFPAQGLYILTLSQEGKSYSQKVSVL